MDDERRRMSKKKSHSLSFKYILRFLVGESSLFVRLDRLVFPCNRKLNDRVTERVVR